MPRRDSGSNGQRDNYGKGFCSRCGGEFSAQGRGLGNLCEECEADLMAAEFDEEIDETEEFDDDSDSDDEDDDDWDDEYSDE